MTTIAIVYHSGFGHTQLVAEAVQAGAAGVEGVDVRLLTAEEAGNDLDSLADVSGIIVELDAPEGKEIAEGHLIARLDEAESRAALQVAEARLRNARIEIERAKPLVAGCFWFSSTGWPRGHPPMHPFG